MSQDKESAWLQFWEEASTESKLMIVGQFAEQRQGYFDTAWLDFVDNILKPLQVEAVNLWKLDAKYQEEFCDFLDNSDSYGWNSFLESSFADYCDRGNEESECWHPNSGN